MEVCYPASETVAILSDCEGKTAKTLKQSLAAHLGVTRFRQRLFSRDGSEISDDEVVTTAPTKVQLVVLEFWPPDADVCI